MSQKFYALDVALAKMRILREDYNFEEFRIFKLRYRQHEAQYTTWV